MRRSLLAAACLLAASFQAVSCSGPGNDAAAPAARFPSRVHDFGKAVQGERVEHAFVVENGGGADLVLERLEPSQGLAVEGFDRVVPAGGSGRIRLAFDTTGAHGQGQLTVRVHSNDPTAPAAVLALQGRVVPVLELLPRDRVYFLGKVQGEGAEEKLILVNHGKEPVAVREVTADNPHIRTRVRTLEPGRRHEIAVTLDPAAPAGRYEAAVTVATDRPDQPAVKVPVRALVEGLVSARPERVWFGTLEAGSLDAATRRRQVLVRRHRGTGFRVLSAETDLPWLTVEVEPQEEGKSFLVNVSIDREKVRKGEIRGTLTVRTNDPAFPRLELPIQGKIL